MKQMKRFAAFLLAFVMVVAMASTACAAVEDTGFADVTVDAWYADAVSYCRENGLMGGITATAFAPDDSMSRAMLATVLYRQAGSPSVTGVPAFADTTANAYYSNAVVWAGENGLISGYGDGLFGTDDAVTREQIAAILWRYAGSPAAEAGQAFADEAAISPYAAVAVDWARAAGIVGGKEGNRFDHAGNATRAEVAAILTRYLRGAQPAPDEPSRTLVAYFSATGNTENIAAHLDDILDAELYEIVPETPYTAADLDYNDASSRVSRENNDTSIRPAIAGGVDNMAEYDVVFLGYPIWWGHAPNIVSTFLEQYDFNGKTIIPFCTSSSSGIGSSATALRSLTTGANWLSGQRFSGNASRSTVESWMDGLDLPVQRPARPDASAAQRLTVSDGTHTVTYALNDSQAARDLYDQLPLTVAVEDYSTNEKIFYPTDRLNTTGAPQAAGGAGTLAYYAPWGDVVLFYDDFGANSQLYGLGTAVEGAASIASLSGTITVTAAE